jgi:hypothetical protein
MPSVKATNGGLVFQAPSGVTVEVQQGNPQYLGLQNTSTLQAAVELGLSIASDELNKADVVVTEDFFAGTISVASSTAGSETYTIDASST